MCHAAPIDDECLTSHGFFRVPGSGSQECYISYRDQHRSWEEAEAHCKSQGLQLAEEPTDAIRLQKYLVETYNLPYYAEYHWLGGRGGYGYWAIQWQTSGDIIPNTSELWAQGHPLGVTTKDCLRLMTNGYGLKEHPEQPYFTYGCEHSYTHTLCQVPKK